MVSAQAEAGKYFSLLSAFFMMISGSIESFRLCNSEDIDLFVQKIPCISHELVKSLLSHSLVLMLKEERRAADTCFFFSGDWTTWDERNFTFCWCCYCCIRLHDVFVVYCTHLSGALLGPKVTSARFPLEERVRGELPKFFTRRSISGGSGLPSSSAGLT